MKKALSVFLLVLISTNAFAGRVFYIRKSGSNPASAYLNVTSWGIEPCTRDSHTNGCIRFTTAQGGICKILIDDVVKMGIDPVQLGKDMANLNEKIDLTCYEDAYDRAFINSFFIKSN